MPVTIEEIHQKFQQNPFFSHIGFEIVQFDEHKIRIKLDVREYLHNINGTLHGGVYATMLDNIMGMVTRSAAKAKVVTLHLSIQFLASISSGEIFAEATIQEQGYKLAFTEGEIKDENGKVLAKGMGTFKLIRNG
ncbi:PaaI family thioesterase [Fictibacillus fluitans]|uniref:PaaI family thioesterase n=1 Tax=Fictibacillus fluitans TaxID=3058422 RepID=A0ABT8HQF4_9BACL|nr:PaaI family thioesterase [Fictibacillus sp. NE201]MDN4522993.1 PaaI family thioesterase [Fictibacillus sp. NE201]